MTQQQTGAEQTPSTVGLLCLIVLIVILDNVGVSIMQLFASNCDMNMISINRKSTQIKKKVRGGEFALHQWFLTVAIS